MNSFWIAVLVSLVSMAAYIWFSVEQQAKQVKVVNSRWLLLPILFLALSPWLYYVLGNYDKQMDWIKVNKDFSELVSAKRSDMIDMDFKDLVLALRTAVDKDPSNGELWFMLAETYYQLLTMQISLWSVLTELK